MRCAAAAASAGEPVQPDDTLFIVAIWVERDGDEATKAVRGANPDLSCPGHAITPTPAG